VCVCKKFIFFLKRIHLRVRNGDISIEFTSYFHIKRTLFFV